jgi:hypothetical protein
MPAGCDIFGRGVRSIGRSTRKGNEAVLSPNGDLLVSTPPTVLTGSQVAEVWDWATGEHSRT